MWAKSKLSLWLLSRAFKVTVGGGLDRVIDTQKSWHPSSPTEPHGGGIVVYRLLFSTMNRAHNLTEDVPIFADREAYPVERSRTSPRVLAQPDSLSYIPILQRRALAGEMVCLEDELIGLCCAESLVLTTSMWVPSMCTHMEASDPFVSRCLQSISQGRPEGRRSG